MDMIVMTNLQARQFMLLKHGLLGEHKFTGKLGIMEYISQTGCVQYDPIDSCGKNSELVLQSRVKDFAKSMLHELLYVDRQLVDYTDKNLAIIRTEDLPYFERYREAARQNQKRYPEMEALIHEVREYIGKNGVICSSDIKLEGDFYWQSAIHWSAGTNLSRSVLEQMYSTGELIIHHKKGTRKYYDFAKNHISGEILTASDPLGDDHEHLKWRVLRRIGAVGLLWNRASDAWLNLWGLKSPERNDIFRQLYDDGEILQVKVDGLKDILYCSASDMPLIEAVKNGEKFEPRCELIAPLDCFMWDRKLIKALFNFEYTWEIYTPQEKRRYGFYVLPMIFGEHFVGRAEIVVERATRTLVVKNIWYEDEVRLVGVVKKSIEQCIKRFSAFNECDKITYM